MAERRDYKCVVLCSGLALVLFLAELVSARFPDLAG
jgi:hypothetical protein